jgi:hypothetical protein
VAWFKDDIERLALRSKLAADAPEERAVNMLGASRLEAAFDDLWGTCIALGS